MKYFRLTLFFIFCSILAFGQNKNDSLFSNKNLRVGFNVYGIAPGFFVEKSFVNNKLRARIGGNYLSLRIPQSVFDLFKISDTIVVAGNFNTGRVYLGVDYKILKNFYATAGIQYHEFSSVVSIGFSKDYKQSIKIDVNNTKDDLSDDIVGTLTVPKELIGNTRIATNTERKIVPFAGFIFDKSANKKFGYKIEMGAVFQGKVYATVDDKIIDSGVDDVKNPGTTIKVDVKKFKEYKTAFADLNSRLDILSILPYLSVSFTYNLF